MAGWTERVEHLNAHLWSYDDRGFLPHGSKTDGHADWQPVWLTDSDENPNGAQVLFLTEGAGSRHLEDFALVCELFVCRDAEAVPAAPGRCRAITYRCHTPTHRQPPARCGREGHVKGEDRDSRV